MKKNNFFEKEAPQPNNLSEAKRIIQELWSKLREYEDRLTLSSRNSSKSPSSDTPASKAERKKLQGLVVKTRLALNLDTRGIDDH
jgi:acyl-CoA thioesterase